MYRLQLTLKLHKYIAQVYKKIKMDHMTWISVGVCICMHVYMNECYVMGCARGKCMNAMRVDVHDAQVHSKTRVTITKIHIVTL